PRAATARIPGPPRTGPTSRKAVALPLLLDQPRHRRRALPAHRPMPTMTTPIVPFTRSTTAVSKRRPAPPIEPLALRRTALKLLAGTLLDAIDRRQRTLLADTLDGEEGLWEQGSYANLLTAWHEPRHRARRTANAFWAVYVAASTNHLAERTKPAELGLDWLEKHPLLQEVYVPEEVSRRYLGDDRMTSEAKRWTKPRRFVKLQTVSGAKCAQKTAANKNPTPHTPPP